MLNEQPVDYTGIDDWEYADDIRPELLLPGSTLGLDNSGHTLGPSEYGVYLRADTAHIVAIGRPRQLMNLAKQIQADLRALTGHLTIKSKQATAWCSYCLQPIEHIRDPQAQADWWQHIVSVEVDCPPPRDMKQATPIQTVRPCQHCNGPVALEPLNRRHHVHLRTRARVCNILNPSEGSALPNTSAVWTPDLELDTRDPWETDL